jgi:hypothetical protein
MSGEGGAMVGRVVCAGCGAEEFIPAHSVPGPCPACGRSRQVTEMVADRRAGEERRAPTHLQREWDYDPRSWFDRRHSGGAGPE